MAAQGLLPLLYYLATLSDRHRHRHIALQLLRRSIAGLGHLPLKVDDFLVRIGCAGVRYRQRKNHEHCQTASSASAHSTVP
jgi:hypothetical protein